MAELARHLEEHQEEITEKQEAAPSDAGASAGQANTAYDEYWRPASNVAPNVTSRANANLYNVCAECGSEFALGAHYCYVCGAERASGTRPVHSRSLLQRVQISRWLDWSELRSALGLTAASLVMFFIGAACSIAAASVGLIYTATTLLDWQAVQMWRIEWLLAAAVAFIAAIVLKK